MPDNPIINKRLKRRGGGREARKKERRGEEKEERREGAQTAKNLFMSVKI